MSKALVLSLLLAFSEARFGQEGAVESVIGALSAFGSPGQAATLAGQSPGVLLAGANACAKLSLADQIVTELGSSAEVIAAAAKLVAAEKNFNPFTQSIPTICDDATLPATEALRGIVPLVDPAVGGSDLENANSAQSLTTPFSASGLSVADVMKSQGFSNFTTQAADGTAGSSAAGAAAASAGPSSSSSTSAAAAATSVVAAAAAGGCGSPPAASAVASSAVASSSSSEATTAAVENAAASSASATAAAGSGAVENAVTGNFPGFVASTVAGADFGKCVPTMKFEAGLDGRKDTEFTFQAIDPLVNKGQEEALNPNIITNRICDQLTNVCGANAAAKTLCQTTKAKISALGTKDQSTADTWNTDLGFAGTNTNPDDAPKAGLVGHT